jgi:hypothetical protein
MSKTITKTIIMSKIKTTKIKASKNNNVENNSKENNYDENLIFVLTKTYQKQFFLLLAGDHPLHLNI